MAEEVVRGLSWTVRDRGAHEVRSAGTQSDGDGRPVRRADLALRDLLAADVLARLREAA